MSDLFTIQVQDAGLLDTLKQLRDRMEDTIPLMDALGVEMEARISHRFETQTDPTGAPWAPLSPSTKKYYPEDGNGRLLDRFGDMLDSLTHRATRDEMLAGFGSVIAVYHEYGTEHMPERHMLFADPDTGTLGEEDQASLLDICAQFFTP